MVKNPPANARDTRDAGLIPGSERSLRNGNLLQNSCLQNVLDRGSWRTGTREGLDSLLPRFPEDAPVCCLQPQCLTCKRGSESIY